MNLKFSLFFVLISFQVALVGGQTSLNSKKDNFTFSSGITFFEGIKVINDNSSVLDIYSPRAIAFNLSAIYSFNLKKGFYISTGLNTGSINFRTLNNSDSTNEFESRNNTFRSIRGNYQTMYLQNKSLFGKSFVVSSRSFISVASGLSMTYVFPYRDSYFSVTKNNNGTFNNVLMFLDNERRFLTGLLFDLEFRRFSPNGKRHLGYGLSFNYVPQLLALGNFRYENNKALSLGQYSQSISSLSFEFEIGLHRTKQ